MRAMRWILGTAIAVMLVAVPYVHYRVLYGHSKRLRAVEVGKLYRSGQLTVEGFRDAVERLHVRTIINAQDELEDPDVTVSYFDRSTIKEQSLCRDLGVKYVHLAPRTKPQRTDPDTRPFGIDEFLAVMDDPANYPVLLHCKAGLHRTGVLSAIYRIEYQGWDHNAALRELKAHGFGDKQCTCSNDYVQQFVLNYQRRAATVRNAAKKETAQR